MSKGKCRQCGKCCQVVVSAISKKAMRELLKMKNTLDKVDRKNLEFASQYWVQISLSIAIHIDIHLIKQLGRDCTVVHYFMCRKLKKDGSCSVYKNRPQVCRGFPIKKQKLFYRGCGYAK